MPLTFLDLRASLPRHTSKSFGRRDPRAVRGFVLHHSAGSDDPVGLARYHVGPNHVSADGCPGLLYTFVVRRNGAICWANDLDRATWSQGGHGSPVPGTSANEHFLAILIGGDFDSDAHDGKNDEPTFEQMLGVLTLISHLAGADRSPVLPEALFSAVPCGPAAIYGHAHFGKPACPGRTLLGIANAARRHLPSPVASLATARDWQLALIALGYDLDPSSPRADGADGIWGGVSKAALVAYQRAAGLPVTGERDVATAASLIAAVAKAGA